MQSKKLIESQFIVKITDIMKEHPDLLKWTDNGTELQLVNIDLFTQKVLPQYFRHNNFISFIRQLNIYSFNKTKKIAKSIWFSHDIFKRGNENNFFLVQRKRKFKELENYQQRFEKQCEDLITEVNNKRQITYQVKEVIVNLLEYKYVSHVNLKRMKCELDALHKDLKDSRNKKIHELATELKSNLLSSISQLTAESKKIDEFIFKNFLRAKEFSETKQIPEPISNELIFSRHLEHVYGMSQTFSKSRSVTNEEPQQYYVTEEVRQNVRPYNSFQVYLEEFKTRKEQFAYDHKLYNPFHSQNSFMFLPNYVTTPSQLPYDGRFSVQYPSVVNQNYQTQEKNATFDNFDESASISFVNVKDFEPEEDQIIAEGN